MDHTMTEKPDRRRGKGRGNSERSAEMRGELIAAGRRLFAEKGFADTSTPEIVAAAGVTRGALYHHFADKTALFAAVFEAESREVAREIEDESNDAASAREALLAGARAYFTAMRAPGRCRILLVDGPAALGPNEAIRLDALHAGRTLREGLTEALAQGALRALPLDALTGVLSAAFDRAALDIASGADETGFLAVFAALVDGLLTPER
ncbi:TetR/AcrR family transcriptional regulator [Stappia sp. 28M-7]|uniref:TetR/AcrR family transcriptional regulator n=1 Tax=Stappia sp. 28M-7 TaxID=2762596 RepID=UPI002738E8F2|nr:TetR/AcrR family transcriptional regulator [Stappia sp. 28M-7]